MKTNQVNKNYRNQKKYLNTILFIHGNATPSATPSRILVEMNNHSERAAAQGERNVAKDHKATPYAMTRFPP